MLFNSYAFLLVFLPAAVLLYALIDPYPRWRTWMLLAISLVFYSYWDVRFFPLMLASILFNWTMAWLFVHKGWRRAIPAAIVTDLLLLGSFKYTNFFATTLTAMLGLPPTHYDIILPLGISFFTFHHVMYLVDLGRGKSRLFPLDQYALYICFFPQAIAGPIARWSEFMHQLGQRVFAVGWEKFWALGISYIVIGLIQKAWLADHLGAAIDPIYQQAATGAVTAAQAWTALGFAVQVFFDFSGYTDIAIGLALLFRIELPRNFDRPLQATSMIDLWQRWHMTLARFLRDYLYLPLSRLPIGGGQARMKRALAAILLTMALCGLWHGAGWTYVLWGTVQGIGIVIAAAWGRRHAPLPRLVGWALTFSFFVLTSVLFRAPSLDAALHIYRGLFSSLPTERPDGLNIMLIALFCVLALPSSQEICRRLTERPRFAVAASLAAVTVTMLVLIGNSENYQFVYFQF